MKTILVFGGNGFIGVETVLRLLENSEHCITLLNRDRSWDYGSKAQILPKVDKFIRWDRKKTLSQCDDFTKYIEKNSKIDFVVDFSGYKPKYITDAISALNNKVDIYIFLSTDSIYEVCEKQHGGFTKETDDNRPSDAILRKRLRQNDKYGYQKWKCEEALRQSGMKFIILRLADVIGEKDSTERWWQLQLWILIASLANLPFYIHEELRTRQISLVYSKDVAKLISDIIVGKFKYIHVQNNAYNLAFNRTVTVEELVHIVASRLKLSNVLIQFSSGNHIPQIYPSVEKGPIDTSKSKGLLDWHPSTLDDVISTCVEFYENFRMNGGFGEKKQDIFETLKDDLKEIYSKDKYQALLQKLKGILSIS